MFLSNWRSKWFATFGGQRQSVLRCAKCYKCLEPKCGGITPDREVEATLVLVIFRLTLSVFNKQHYFLKTERM